MTKMNDRNYVKQILTIKDYKLTLNALADELKTDRPKKKSRYFVDLIQTAIQGNDFDSLVKLWKEYEILYFKFLDFDKQRTADIMKSEMYKAYLVECFKNKKTDKINSFFQSMGYYMLNNKSEWNDWFEFPFLKLPSEHKVFSIYFTRLWSDNFYLSLVNFFMQVVRSVMSSESDLEKFFSFDTRLDNCINQLEKYEIEAIKQKYYLSEITMDKSQLSSHLVSGIQMQPRHLHDVTELFCDFRLTRENKQPEYRKLSKSNKPKVINLIIQNKAKISSPNTFLRKKTPVAINIDNVEGKDNLEKIDEQILTDHRTIESEHQILSEENISNPSSFVSANVIHYVSPDPTKSPSVDSFGIKQLSNKISQKIFKPKSSIGTDIPKPLIHHEHFSMVTHVKFSRMPVPYWASLDVGGTFKIWSTNELSSKSLHTLSFKHTIYSFDWVSCSSNLILLGTKGGSIKLFNVNDNEIIHEMVIDSSYPRINIVQSFDKEAKFVCESLDRSRATLSNTILPQGIVSLYDTENWSSIRTNLMTLNSDFTVNCINCSSDTIVAGCSNGSVQMVDVRLPYDAVFSSLPVFNSDEVVNVINMCQSKWSKSSMGPNYLMCLSSKSHLKMFDIRQTSKSLPKESFHLTDLNIPLSWTERPYGGEQTIYFPRANLISAAFINSNLLFSAAKKGINIQKIVGSTLSEPTPLNAGHNSPVICIDSSPSDLNDSSNAVVISGTMEGTISTIKINTNK